MRRPDADVLIAGGGLAAQRVCGELRRLGHDGRIRVICEEPCAPYDRPPLSKGILLGERPADPPLLKPADWYAENEIDLLLDATVCALDPAHRRVDLAEGTTLRYRDLVVATGSRPRCLRSLPVGGRVRELRTIEDARGLRRELASGRSRVAIVGAGLVGLEVASSAVACGATATVIEAAPTPLARVLHPKLGRWLTDMHLRAGVDVRLETTVERASAGHDCLHLALSDGHRIEADFVLVAVGTTPATEWTVQAGLGGGSIEVDSAGRSALPGVYAAGDVAAFPDASSGRHIPSQHWEAAAAQGVAVARTICRAPPRAQPPAMFWTDQHGVRINVVGTAAGADRIDVDGDPARPDFTAWLLRRGRAVGALLAGRPQALAEARGRVAGDRRGPAVGPVSKRTTRRRNGLSTVGGRDSVQRARRL